jgi:hypothetical protein
MKMRAFRASGWFLFLMAAICCVSCRHTEQHALISSHVLPWAGFGTSGAGKIMVEVGGRDLQHPGSYYLDDGANLESVYYSFGGWYVQGDSPYWPPVKVILSHSDGTRTIYRISKMTKEEKESVRLKDGDRLIYEHTTF